MKRRLHFGSGELIILIVIGVLFLVIITGNYRQILNTIYGPVPPLIAVVMLIEYLLLKGADRSPIYRRELEAAHDVRRDDVLALRAIESDLVDLRARLAAPESDPAAAPQLVEASLQAIDRILPQLRAWI